VDFKDWYDIFTSGNMPTEKFPNDVIFFAPPLDLFPQVSQIQPRIFRNIV
jgi:hypothetical protein